MILRRLVVGGHPRGYLHSGDSQESKEGATVGAGGEKTVYKGKPYYSCRMMCRQRFIMNPEKYLKQWKSRVTRQIRDC